MFAEIKTIKCRGKKLKSHDPKQSPHSVASRLIDTDLWYSYSYPIREAIQDVATNVFKYGDQATLPSSPDSFKDNFNSFINDLIEYDREHV